METRTAIDELEPIASANAYRDAARLCLDVLDSFADLLINSEHPPTAIRAGQHYIAAVERLFFMLTRYNEFVLKAENTLLAAHQGALALGLPCCGEGNYEAVARKCGVGLLSPGKGRAAVSKGVTFFQEANSLPPSFYQKSQAAKQEYRKERIARVVRGHNKA